MTTTFIAYEVTLELCRQMRPLLARMTDRQLVEQTRDALSSAVMNLREGNRRRGADRRRCFRVAAGSADEVRGALDFSIAIGDLDAAACADALACADRVQRLLWPLVR